MKVAASVLWAVAPSLALATGHPAPLAAQVLECTENTAISCGEAGCRTETPNGILLKIDTATGFTSVCTKQSGCIARRARMSLHSGMLYVDEDDSSGQVSGGPYIVVDLAGKRMVRYFTLLQSVSMSWYSCR